MNGVLSEFYVGTILDMYQRVFYKIADNYENIRKGVSSIIGGRILEYPIKLCVSLLIAEGCDDIFDDKKILTVCAQACGTGGMLSTV